MEVKLIKNECDRAGLPIVSVACVAVGLIDFNPSVQRFHVDRVKSYLDMCRTFAAKNLLLVIGEYIWNKEVIPPPEQWAMGAKNLKTLGKYAGELGLEIALEMEPFALSLLNDVPNMARFLDDVGEPNVKANVDISHMVLAHQPPEALDVLRQKAARLGADKVIGVEFHHGEAGEEPSHLSGVAVRCRAFLQGRRYDVLGTIDVRGNMGSEERALAELKSRAFALHADLVIGVQFEHGEGEGKPSRLTGTAIRFVRE